MNGEQPTKITIDIEKEPLLRYWAEQASKYGRGYLSNTIRLAIEYYIMHQSCMEIAKLHPPEPSYTYERQPLLVFRYGMSPTICSWLDTLRNVGISQTVAIRYVLLNSLTVISDDEKEFMINSDYICETSARKIDFGQYLAKTTARLSQNVSKEKATFFLSPGPDGPGNAL